jgi:uncharacterized protein (DUF2267 family)
MTDTGYATFSTTVDKTNRLLKDIEDAYGWPHDLRNQSYDALREVLHALRDRLTVAEAAEFGAQLPMLVRGLYYEGWRPERTPVKMSREEFLQRIHDRLEFDVDDQGGVESLVSTVLSALSTFVTPGEWEDVRSHLPKDFADLVPA